MAESFAKEYFDNDVLTCFAGYVQKDWSSVTPAFRSTASIFIHCPFQSVSIWSNPFSAPFCHIEIGVLSLDPFKGWVPKSFLDNGKWVHLRGPCASHPEHGRDFAVKPGRGPLQIHWKRDEKQMQLLGVGKCWERADAKRKDSRVRYGSTMHFSVAGKVCQRQMQTLEETLNKNDLRNCSKRTAMRRLATHKGWASCPKTCWNPHSTSEYADTGFTRCCK